MFTEGEAAPLGSGSGGGRAEGPPSLEEALALVERAQAALAAVELDGEDSRKVLRAAVALEGLGNQQASQRLRLLGEIERRGAYTLDGAVTGAAWYRGRVRVWHAAAAREVNAARRLASFPELRAALQAGEVSLAHVTAVTDAAVPRRCEALAAADATLATLARRASPREVRRAVAVIRDHVDPDGADGAPPPGADEAGPDERRRLSLARTVDGLWDLSGVLDPLAGEALATLIDAYEAPDGPETAPEQRRSPGQRRADALDAAVRQALARGDAPTVGGASPHMLATIDLLELFDLAEAAGAPETAAPGSADAVDAAVNGGGDETLRALSEALQPGGPRPGARLRHGGALTPAVARRLARQAKLTAVLTLGPWRVVSVGRTQRTLPPWLRVVLDAVHGHCRGPDCDRPISWSEAHHQLAWAVGGDTDLNATIPLCRAHHGLVTAGTWHVSFDPDTGVCTWTDPHGRVIRTHPP